jgi:hypothetical protein
LQEQLIVRVLAHRPVEELHLAALLLELLEQYHLMDIIAGQTIWRGHHHPIKPAFPNRVPEAIESGAIQFRPTVASVPENQSLIQNYSLGLEMVPESLQLLVYRLLLDLIEGGYPDVHGDSCLRCLLSWRRRFRPAPAPLQQLLIGQVPAAPTVRGLNYPPSNLPSTFHGTLRGNPFPRRDIAQDQPCGVATSRNATTSAPDGQTD